MAGSIPAEVNNSGREGKRSNPWAIGETAGAVWQYLKDHGKSAPAAVEKVVPIPAGAVALAVGWLARGGKL
jgi:hypothetical protein